MTKHKEKKCKCKWPNGAILKGITERGGWLCSKCGEEIKDDKMGYISLSDTGCFYDSLKNKTLHTKKNKAGGVVVVGISDNTLETKTNNWS